MPFLWLRCWYNCITNFLLLISTSLATPPPHPSIKSWPVVGKMTPFDLWPLPLGGGAWGAGTNMWHPEIPASYESLPTILDTQIPTLWVHISGGRGRGGALILGWCRAFDYLQVSMPTSDPDPLYWLEAIRIWRPDVQHKILEGRRKSKISLSDTLSGCFHFRLFSS